MLTHFRPMFLFYNSLKTPENQRFFVVFREYKVGTLTRNGLTKAIAFLMNPFHNTRLFLFP